MTEEFEIEICDGKKKLIKYHGSNPNVVIPDDIDIIGESAFRGNQTLTSITIPGSVTEMEGRYYGIFYQCNNLVKVILQEGVKMIGDGAFSHCKALKYVQIPNSIRKIGDHAFSDCSSLSTVVIPDNVSEIGQGTFWGCEQLTSIDIPDAVNKIGSYAFWQCVSLIIIKIPDSVSDIGVSAFSDCSHLTSIVIPHGLKEISEGSFKGCSSLIHIFIPESVKNIGKMAFAECTSLTSVSIPEGVRQIDESAFRGCKSLTSVQIPDSVKTIEKEAFLNTPFFSNLSGDLKISGRFLLIYTGQESEIRIPEGISVICEAAFAGNEMLTSVILPKSIEVINPTAFKKCKNLKELWVFYQHTANPTPEIPGFGYVSVKLLDLDNQIIAKLYILDSEKNMPYTNFLSRLMGGGVAHLSEYDALFSSSDEIIVRKIRAAMYRLQYPLELGEQYKKEYVFYLKNNAGFFITRCIKEGDTASINLLANSGAIPEEGINKWIDLANELSNLEILAFLLDYKNKFWGQKSGFNLDLGDNVPGEWATQENLDGSLNINEYLGSQHSVTIPAMIKGKKVKKIEGRIGSLRLSVFFMIRDLIESITIEDGIEQLAERTFENCTSLSFAQIPRSVIEIGKYAFYNCPNLAIYAPRGSYAIEYAREYNIKFVEM